MPYKIIFDKDGFKVCKKDDSKCFSKHGLPLETAQKQLKAIGINERLSGGAYEDDIVKTKAYLDVAKKRAKRAGYNPLLLKLSSDSKHKLNYNGVDFGLRGYNDYIVYLFKVVERKINIEDANKHRKNYRSRAEKIRGNWKENPESPNNLAINILW